MLRDRHEEWSPESSTGARRQRNNVSIFSTPRWLRQALPRRVFVARDSSRSPPPVSQPAPRGGRQRNCWRQNRQAEEARPRHQFASAVDEAAPSNQRADKCKFRRLVERANRDSVAHKTKDTAHHSRSQQSCFALDPIS